MDGMDAMDVMTWTDGTAWTASTVAPGRKIPRSLGGAAGRVRTTCYRNASGAR